jgi:hypothetical protein
MPPRIPQNWGTLNVFSPQSWGAGGAKVDFCKRSNQLRGKRGKAKAKGKREEPWWKTQDLEYPYPYGGMDTNEIG